MCGRFTLRTPMPVLIEHFGLEQVPGFAPRFNIAPTQQVAVIRSLAVSAQRQWVMLRWGLIPSWATDPAVGSRMINARAETVAEKRSFRVALRRRRCLVAADGFFEWKRTGRQKVPYFIRRPDDGPIAFAGLWDSWCPPDDPQASLETCAIITTRANTLVQSIHDRMPVIVSPEQYALWLDPAVAEPNILNRVLAPCPDDALCADPVSSYVNSPRHDDPKCLQIVFQDA